MHRAVLCALATPLAPAYVAAVVYCRVHFVLLPTAYGFAAGHCVRVAVAGADSKHFTVDHEGDRTLWIHAGEGCHG